MKTINWKFKEKDCIICNKKFKPTNGKQLTCNEKCKEKLHLINSSKYNHKYPERVSKSVREYSQRNKEKVSKLRGDWNKNNKEVYNARSKTNYENRKLNLKEGVCKDCKENKKLEAHHLSYNPNKFILICKDCHYKRHNKRSRK